MFSRATERTCQSPPSRRPRLPAAPASEALWRSGSQVCEGGVRPLSCSVVLPPRLLISMASLIHPLSFPQSRSTMCLCLLQSFCACVNFFVFSFSHSWRSLLLMWNARPVSPMFDVWSTVRGVKHMARGQIRPAWGVRYGPGDKPALFFKKKKGMNFL